MPREFEMHPRWGANLFRIEKNTPWRRFSATATNRREQPVEAEWLPAQRGLLERPEGDPESGWNARERSGSQFVLYPDSAGRAGFCRVSTGHRTADRPERANRHSSSRTTRDNRAAFVANQVSGQLTKSKKCLALSPFRSPTKCPALGIPFDAAHAT